MSQRLKGAVIGYGFISGKGHIPAYLERARTRKDVEITAVADICAGRREAASRELPNARVYDSYEALLEAESGKLDFVDVSTPPYAHAEIAAAAFDRGLHVLCEKPLTTTVAEAEDLIRRARAAKRVLFPCHNYKHAPVVKAIQEIIDSGRIGKVRSLSLQTFRNTHAKGVTEWKTHWRREKKWSGGGIAMDHGSHTFYLTFDWLGSYPTSVTAKMLTADAPRYDTEDTFSAVLTFPTGVAASHLTWKAGVRKVIYAVQGEKGGVTVDDDNLELATMEATTGPDVAQGAVKWNVEKRSISSHWMDASHVQWFDSLFDQFRGAIERGEHVGREAMEAYLCIQIIESAYRSASEKCREVELSGAAHLF